MRKIFIGGRSFKTGCSHIVLTEKSVVRWFAGLANTSNHHVLILRVVLVFFLCGISMAAMSQEATDSDADGLSDSFEGALLHKFQPQFEISKEDCAGEPAKFAPGAVRPTVLAEDGTFYGQAFPRKTTADGQRQIELHFYHLWRADCGRMGHPLDAEHVSALLRGSGSDASQWKAAYWYAAAHEDTVCDASQVSRASTLEAETHGPRIWISKGKHGSFLNEELCQRGCGGDRCADTMPLVSAGVVNLGEYATAMNGAAWSHSKEWPLAAKMRRSDFPADRTSLMEREPETNIVWANPEKRPAQAAILGGNAAIDGAMVGGGSTADALAVSESDTNTALVLARARSGDALETTTQKTGNALTKSYRGVRHALGTAAKRTGGALGVGDGKKSTAPPR
jgi:hypothetical protein